MNVQEKGKREDMNALLVTAKEIQRNQLRALRKVPKRKNNFLFFCCFLISEKTTSLRT